MSARPAAPALRRRDADRRFGIRLFGSAAAAAVAAVLFGLVLVLVESGWHPLRRLDAGAARWLNRTALDHPAWTGTLRFFSDVVWDPVTLRAAVAVLTLWLVYRRAWRLAAWSAVTAVAGGLIGLLAKTVVERARRGLRPLLWAVPIVSVLGVGFTRVALGVHWFSDVAGGWTLGLAVVALTGWSFEAWRADAGLGHADVAEGLEPELSGDDPEATGPNP